MDGLGAVGLDPAGVDDVLAWAQSSNQSSTVYSLRSAQSSRTASAKVDSDPTDVAHGRDPLATTGGTGPLPRVMTRSVSREGGPPAARGADPRGRCRACVRTTGAG